MTVKQLKEILKKYPKECDNYEITITLEEYWETDDCYHTRNIPLPEPESILPGTNKIVFDITE